MAYHKRSMKHRKSSRRHLKARRTRARRGGGLCTNCRIKYTIEDDKWCMDCQRNWRSSKTNPGNLWH